MKLATAAAALFLPAISAFAPASLQKPTTSTALKAYESMPGATAPVGYWDPLNLTSDKEQEQFDKARVGEVKNGRAGTYRYAVIVLKFASCADPSLNVSQPCLASLAMLCPRSTASQESSPLDSNLPTFPTGLTPLTLSPERYVNCSLSLTTTNAIVY